MPESETPERAAASFWGIPYRSISVTAARYRGGNWSIIGPRHVASSRRALSDSPSPSSSVSQLRSPALSRSEGAPAGSSRRCTGARRDVGEPFGIVAALRCAVIVRDGIAGDLKEPRDEPLLELHGIGVPMDAKEDLLEDVVGVRVAVYPSPDEDP